MEFTNWDFQIYDSPVDLVSYSILGAYIFPCICERKVCFLGATTIQGESIKTIIRSDSFLIDFIEKKERFKRSLSYSRSLINIWLNTLYYSLDIKVTLSFSTIAI